MNENNSWVNKIQNQNVTTKIKGKKHANKL